MNNYVNRIILACPTMDTFAVTVFHLVCTQEYDEGDDKNNKCKLMKELSTKEKISIKELMEFMDKINLLKDNDLIDMNRDLDIKDFMGNELVIQKWLINSNIKFYIPETIHSSPTFLMKTEFNHVMDYKGILSNVLKLSDVFKEYGAIFTYAFEDSSNNEITIAICKDGNVVDYADTIKEKGDQKIKKYKELKKMIGIEEE